jgi:hypothetical protein
MFQDFRAALSRDGSLNKWLANPSNRKKMKKSHKKACEGRGHESKWEIPVYVD